MIIALSLALGTIMASTRAALTTDYTPISELTAYRSPDGKTLSGRLVLGRRWSASNGWGKHGQPWPYFASNDNEALFLNNPWNHAGLSASFVAADGSDVVDYTVTRSAGTFNPSGWLMLVLEGHEYWRGEHTQQQFFAVQCKEQPGPTPEGQTPIIVTQSGPPGGSVIPITLHRRIDAQAAMRKILNWGGSDITADEYTFSYKGSPTPGATWTRFDPSPSREGSRTLAFAEPAYECYAAEAKQWSSYATLGGTWSTAAGVIRTKTSRTKG